MSSTTPSRLLHQWLACRLEPAALTWLDGQLARLQEHDRDRDLYLAVGLAPRKVGKADLALTEAELADAEIARSGWWPGDWSVDQAARLLLLLSAPGDAERFAQRLEQLLNTSDVGEAMAFYRGLPLYPEPERYAARAAEGVRTNMKGVFESVAHHNPYPVAHLSEGAWNQMVLKALFIGTRLHPIRDLEARSNPALREMLVDYAHERWAAGRDVSPELWRCVGPVADDRALDDLERVLTSGADVERRAAALALKTCPEPRAGTILGGTPEIAAAVERGEITWDRIVEEL